MGFEPGQDSPVACTSQRSNPLGHRAPSSEADITLCLLGVNRAYNHHDKTRTSSWHYTNSVRLANRKSKMAAIFQDGHLRKKQYFRKLGLLGRIIRGDQIYVLRTANSSRNVAGLSDQNVLHIVHILLQNSNIYIYCRRTTMLAKNFFSQTHSIAYGFQKKNNIWVFSTCTIAMPISRANIHIAML